MSQIRNLARKILRRKNSTTKEFWEKSAKSTIDKTIDKICTGFNEKKFNENTKPFFTNRTFYKKIK